VQASSSSSVGGPSDLDSPDVAGAGSLTVSSFPLVVSGRAASAVTVAGTMYSGRMPAARLRTLPVSTPAGTT
jgi:hypothetical protein